MRRGSRPVEQIRVKARTNGGPGQNYRCLGGEIGRDWWVERGRRTPEAWNEAWAAACIMAILRLSCSISWSVRSMSSCPRELVIMSTRRPCSLQVCARCAHITFCRSTSLRRLARFKLAISIWSARCKAVFSRPATSSSSCRIEFSSSCFSMFAKLSSFCLSYRGYLIIRAQMDRVQLTSLIAASEAAREFFSGYLLRLPEPELWKTGYD